LVVHCLGAFGCWQESATTPLRGKRRRGLVFAAKISSEILQEAMLLHCRPHDANQINLRKWVQPASSSRERVGTEYIFCELLRLLRPDNLLTISSSMNPSFGKLKYVRKEANPSHEKGFVYFCFLYFNDIHEWRTQIRYFQKVYLIASQDSRAFVARRTCKYEAFH